jgi:hypothetical protein
VAAVAAVAAADKMWIKDYRNHLDLDKCCVWKTIIIFITYKNEI